MAANKVVEVLCLNGHRQKVKTTAGFTILQILQEVCKKQRFDDAEVDLIHQRKVLDITATMRYTNIPNNGKLEMVKRAVPRKKASTVNLAIQTDFGERLQSQFSPSSSLLDVLKHWEGEPGSAYHGKIIHKIPVVIYMSHQICGLQNLQTTTLEKLGLIGGNAILRLSHRDDEDLEMTSPSTSKEDLNEKSKQKSIEAQRIEKKRPSQEDSSVSLSKQTSSMETESQQGQDDEILSRGSAMDIDVSSNVEQTEIGKFKNPKDRIEPLPKKPKLPKEAIVTDEDIEIISRNTRPLAEFKFPERSQQHVDASGIEAIDPKRMMMEERLAMPCERQTLVFSLDRPEQPSIERTEPDDNFYEVTVDDIRHRMQEMKAKLREDDPLLTKGLREAKEADRISQYKQVVIRVQFPNRMVLQAVFRPLEKVRTLKDFVREQLQNRDERFYLYTTPPRCILKNGNQTLYQAKLTPSGVVHVSGEKSPENWLKNELMENAITCDEAEEAAFTILRRYSNKTASRQSTSSSSQTNRKPDNSEFMPSKTTTKSDGKGPKWFNSGKK